MNNVNRRNFIKMGSLTLGGLLLGGCASFANAMTAQPDEQAANSNAPNALENFDELHYQFIEGALHEYANGNYRLNALLYTEGVNPQNPNEKWTIDGLSRYIDAEYDLIRGTSPQTDVNTLRFDTMALIDPNNQYDTTMNLQFSIFASEQITNTMGKDRPVFNVIPMPGFSNNGQSAFQMRKLTAQGTAPMQITSDNPNKTPDSIISSFKSTSGDYGFGIFLPGRRINPFRNGQTIGGKQVLRLVDTNISGEKNHETLFQENMYFTPNRRYAMPTPGRRF